MSITYADAGIKVSCVCPQAVNTPLLAVALEGDPVGSAPMMADPVLEPEDVATEVVHGIADERFLILPHADVAKYMALKGAQPERWLAGNRYVRICGRGVARSCGSTDSRSANRNRASAGRRGQTTGRGSLELFGR